MAFATVLGITSLALGALSAAKAHGAARAAGDAYDQAGELSRQSSYANAYFLDANSRIAGMQAADAVARGAEEENRFRMGVRQMVGSQRAGFAGNNIDVGWGSPVDVVADTEYLGELDAMQIRTNAAREAWGFQIQAHDYRSRARLARREGDNVREQYRIQGRAARAGATVNLIGNAAALAGQAYGFVQAGRH